MPISRFQKAATTVAPSASSPSCAAISSRGRPPRCCARPKSWSKRASRNCWSSRRTPAPMAATCAMRESHWREREVSARFLDLTRELATLGAWVRLHYVYPYPHVDEVIGSDERRQSAALYRRAVPARFARGAQGDEAAGQSGEDAGAPPRLAGDLPRSDDPLDLHRRLSRRNRRGFPPAARLARRSQARPRRRLQI